MFTGHGKNFHIGRETVQKILHHFREKIKICLLSAGYVVLVITCENTTFDNRKFSKIKQNTMTSKLFGIYDPKHVDMQALDLLIEKWLRRRGRRIFPLPLIVGPEYCINFKFGCGDVATFEKQEFDQFYDQTRINFFMDESKSTFRDALYELQPDMLKYFLDAMDKHFLPSASYTKPAIVEIDEEWWENWLETHTADEASACDERDSCYIVEQERQRKSKRLCVIQKAASNCNTLSSKRRKVEEIICTPDDSAAVVRKPRKSNFNCVQWKHLQVQARKQLHEAALSFDFAYVKLIAKEWEHESEEERRLDVDAIEWAFRRICKQLLPHSAEKEALMRQNSIKMIETLFECFKSMNLCKPKCMRLHIIGICRDLENRTDISNHMFNYRCACCLSLQV